MKAGTLWTRYALVWMVVFVALTAGAQQEPAPPRHDKFRDDPHAFCYKGPEDGSAHNCACAMVCGPDTAGNQVQQETTSCALFCTRSRCACHSDETCDMEEPI